MANYTRAILEAKAIMQWNGAGFGKRPGDIQGVKIHPEIMRDIDDDCIKDGMIFGIPITIDSNVKTFEIGQKARKRSLEVRGWSFWIFEAINDTRIKSEWVTAWLEPSKILEKEGAAKFAGDDLLCVA